MRGDGRRNRREIAGGLRLDRVARLHRAPAIVAAALDEMDHFPELPADIANPEAPPTIKAHLPGIAKAEGPDFRTNIGATNEGIVRRNAILEAPPGCIDINTQDGRQNV